MPWYKPSREICNTLIMYCWQCKYSECAYWVSIENSRYGNTIHKNTVLYCATLLLTPIYLYSSYLSKLIWRIRKNCVSWRKKINFINKLGKDLNKIEFKPCSHPYFNASKWKLYGRYVFSCLESEMKMLQFLAEAF